MDRRRFFNRFAVGAAVVVVAPKIISELIPQEEYIPPSLDEPITKNEDVVSGDWSTLYSAQCKPEVVEELYRTYGTAFNAREMLYRLR